jgi:hypothetical protein
VRIVCALAVGGLTTLAMGQPAGSVPFYYGVGTAYTPQIATLVVGVNQDVGQAVVSGDRKYLALNIDASLLGSGGIHQFKYQKTQQGFVGAAPVPQRAPARAGSLTPTIAASPDEIAPPVSILDKPGMVLIAPLE